MVLIFNGIIDTRDNPFTCDVSDLEESKGAVTPAFQAMHKHQNVSMWAKKELKL